MKKILAILLVAVMSLTFLTGCSDPVYDELEAFINVDMEEINANYEKITAEASTWTEIEDVAALESSAKDTLLPLIDDSITKLNAINPSTDEVKDLKAKYMKVMELYKEAFEMILADDADQMAKGNEILTEGVAALDEYNMTLEALAAEYGAEIQY